ncbi:hypothetical protein SAMN05444365_105150 [Micromonospora pattaloongensis]|uniref:Uncharacterized protein n=1 Tax=Micromonospora pattaloongensis TaxID=405436 RepID=A0A1H3Q0X0_9ACTN|nr:hypothetical protein [Micromonospora pattaloongensis]SDZ06861.1 hypothetical protein SAMN05444365_105150 [Micromonospora pattaloongensis]
MSTWQGVRREMAGAWRSLRYDLTRRAAAKRRAERPVAGENGHRARRLLAMAAFGLLAVVGATGTYFGVVAGLGALLSASQPPVEPVPAAVRPDRPVTEDVALTPDPTRHPAVSASPAPARPGTPSPSPSRESGRVPAPASPSPSAARTPFTPPRTSPTTVPSSSSPSATPSPTPSASAPATPTEVAAPPPTPVD